MSEWKKYEGTDEQIAEMLNAKHGFIYLDKYQAEGSIMHFADFFDKTHLRNHLETWEVTHYLICNPHPLADMIERQARTGQPVFIRCADHISIAGKNATLLNVIENGIMTFKTCWPDWNIPFAEYSFEPFGEEK